MIFVNVLLNGDYRGIYMLSEAVNCNPDCRIDVDKEADYIFEWDAYWWNEDLYFESLYGNKYTFKHPDTEALMAALDRSMPPRCGALGPGNAPRGR